MNPLNPAYGPVPETMHMIRNMQPFHIPSEYSTGTGRQRFCLKVVKPEPPLSNPQFSGLSHIFTQYVLKLVSNKMVEFTVFLCNFVA